MLFKNTVTEECWFLLSELMSFDWLSSFRLVGGTALSLQFGHRVSDDIDLFSNVDFEPIVLEQQLKKYYSGAQLSNVRRMTFGIFSYIYNTKVDFIYWGEGFIKDVFDIEDIRMASLEDIMAMKLEAITNRSSKKDFYDLAILFNKFSLKEGIDFYEEKFPYNDPMGVLKNLTNFEKADTQPDPILLNCPSWEETKYIITSQFDEFFKDL